jgi:Flp pilus assembly protein TadG
MRRTRKATGRRYERGAIAVETAIVLPILLLIIGLPSIYLAFYYRQYSAAQKALHDAVLYLSTAPRIEMITAGPDGNPAALTLANTIMAKELAGIVPSGTSLDPNFICVYQVGGNPAMKLCTVAHNQDPTHKLIQLGVSIQVTYIDPLTGSDTGISIAPYAPVAYVGN